MNPPFKGAIDKGDVSPALPGDTTKTELLFVHLILRALDMGGCCAAIVPDGVLFGSSRAHLVLSERLIEENHLDGVVSMPSGVFKPYAGVSTAVLFFTRGARTERVWFYDMAGDGFSLDDKRTSGAHNDIPDVVACWQKRQDAAFQAGRAERVNALRVQLAPLKAERLQAQVEINRLTFENVIANEDGTAGRLQAAQQRLAELARRSPRCRRTRSIDAPVLGDQGAGAGPTSMIFQPAATARWMRMRLITSSCR